MFKDSLNSISPYKPGKSIESIQKISGKTDIIKLASNENPLGPAVDISEIACHSERYPDYTTHPFIPQLARHLGVDPTQLILGNGSDEILQMVALACISPGDEILSSSCTFSEYKFVAQITGATYVEAPMKDHTVHVKSIINAITKQTKIIFIANPNNPTGTIITHDDVVQILNAASSTTLVVLDEAYAEYATHPDYPNAIDLIAQYPNLMVTRTFSKIYGLAALRVGYGMAQAPIIQGIQKVRQPFNVNGLALEAASMALKNHAFVERSLEINRLGHSFLRDALRPLDGHIPPSQANFLFIDFTTIHADALCDALIQRGVIVRSMVGFGEPTAIRVTVGTENQNQRFITELFECLKQL